MSEPVDIYAIRAEALRKLGRNVVNFQKVEACLKYLVVMCSIQGNPTNVADRQRAKEARVRKQSLGNLADALHREVFADDVTSEAPASISEIWISVSMKIKADPNETKQRKRDLAALIAERNKLIHHDLVHFNHNSVESCKALIENLDGQNSRILKQLDALKLLIDTFKRNLAEMQAWIDSDNFLEQLRLDASDA